ncbi:NAD-dependent malic enzyme, mitochondrial [Vermiconidia calcicola]|uniref:NAD-dependent malic enzyme, mitochondrial n=1 Tax=Vermiconidia calcicola TaxID=1690605 RepID=A0ACC3NGW6_9PEZI|nr:NAD-dependent malic enzyme, mitochondrial [Vermiconidia calcicola]
MSKNKHDHLPFSTSGPMDCALTGGALLRSPYLNKGSAFTTEERHEFKLNGLLPPQANSLEEQVTRAYDQFQTHKTPLGKNTFMASMKEQNEVLYYRLIQDHLREMMPVIYTPAEAEAISDYSRIFRQPEGCFLNISEPEKIEDVLDRWGPPDDIDIIACSDGEQILGIGDQGVGAILISVAKLVIYTLCAGIHPQRVLPVGLDVGTDNQQLLEDELYLGLHRPRVRGDEYDAFIDRFVQACRKRYHKAYIHFEDFGLHNARRILDKYTPTIACFNDDVQGTGAVTLAAIYAAAHVAKLQISDLRVILFGVGSAGTGIADQLRDAIAIESEKSKEEATQQIWCVDKPGLLLESLKDDLTPAQHPYAKNDSEWIDVDCKSLLEVVKRVKPHVLIGTSTQPKSFTKEIVEEMSKHVERPIIFPLSNPTRLHEAEPKDLFDWTDGRVLTATGSPFPPVEMKDGRKREIAECNNSTMFPGIGLGVVLSRSKLVTPALLVAAVKALAAQAPALEDPEAALLPDVTEVRDISVKIAAAVIQQAVQDGLAQQEDIPSDKEELEEWIGQQMWKAEYRPLRKVSKEHGDRTAKGEAGSRGVSDN